MWEDANWHELVKLFIKFGQRLPIKFLWFSKWECRKFGFNLSISIENKKINESEYPKRVGPNNFSGLCISASLFQSLFLKGVKLSSPATVKNHVKPNSRAHLCHQGNYFFNLVLLVNIFVLDEFAYMGLRFWSMNLNSWSSKQTWTSEKKLVRQQN